LLAAGEVGIRLLPNVGGLSVTGNAFVENQQQVEVAGAGGDPAANLWRDNHWSDYAGFDADGDGIGDVPYRSEKLYEQIVDRRPELRLFALSPAVPAIDFAARAFPLDTPALPARTGSGVSWPAGAALLAAALLLLLPLSISPRGGAARAPRDE